MRRGKGRFARDYDLHNVVGAVCLPFLLMWGVTGAAFEFPQVETAWLYVTGGHPVDETYGVYAEPQDGPCAGGDAGESDGRGAGEGPGRGLRRPGGWPVADARPVDATRVLLWAYGVFVVAAGSRSAVQLLTHQARAPLAYALSALAALVYAVGFVLIWRAARRRRPGPVAACAVAELTGVLAVGTASVLDPGASPDATVWSYFGAGYLCVPLILPVLVLLWLRRPPAAVQRQSGDGE